MQLRKRLKVGAQIHRSERFGAADQHGKHPFVARERSSDLSAHPVGRVLDAVVAVVAAPEPVGADHRDEDIARVDLFRERGREVVAASKLAIAERRVDLGDFVQPAQPLGDPADRVASIGASVAEEDPRHPVPSDRSVAGCRPTVPQTPAPARSVSHALTASPGVLLRRIATRGLERGRGDRFGTAVPMASPPLTEAAPVSLDRPHRHGGRRVLARSCPFAHFPSTDACILAGAPG